MVFSNYRELVRAADADPPTLKLRRGLPAYAKALARQGKWFGITPEAVEAVKKQRAEASGQRPADMVDLPKAAAAA